MMRNLKTWQLILLLLVLCAVAAVIGNRPASVKGLHYVMDGDIASISVDNDTLTLNLRSNPTTGYLWEYDETSDLRIVERYAPDEEGSIDGNIAGAGGTTTFEIIPDTSGTITTQFRYRRPWEDVSESAEVCELYMEVSEKKNVRCEGWRYDVLRLIDKAEFRPVQ